MRNINNFKMKMAVLASVAGLALYSTGATAATQSVTANIAFESAITLTKNFDINFGFVTALSASTYAISTAAVVTTTAGSGVQLGGTSVAGNILIQGSATQTISITANSYTANNGVTPSLARCKYGVAAEAACDSMAGGGVAAPTGAGTTLLVGVSVAASGAQAAGTTAAPTFDIVVNYG